MSPFFVLAIQIHKNLRFRKGKNEKRQASALPTDLRFDFIQSTLPDLANSVGVNRWNIENALREETGCGFRELKNQARFGYIAARLAEENTRVSIKDMAKSFGITPNALSRFIRSKAGKSARELRRKKSLHRMLAKNSRQNNAVM
jgi:methylphosphotriester-DNA--protein-cysteine methyltransferase